jgi:DNA-binding winged helix-turn-helix (wHTH) protein
VRCRFGEFTLDTSTRRLLRGDAESHLSPKAFDLLLLVANASRALAKGDLVQHLWPSTYVVETNLASLIHFRFADAVARRQSKQAADWAFAHLLRPLE